MRAAVVSELGGLPSVADVPEPEPGPGEVVLEVEAAAVNPIDVAVSAGRHYAGHPPLPFVPGCEAVGRADGRRAWAFAGGIGLQRDGTMAERVAVPRDRLFDVPEGADSALACALGIAGLAGWMPMAWRARLRQDETVLVLGATGTAGLVAVQAARLHGAARIVAAGRDRERLGRATARGADATVELGVDTDLVQAFREACGGDGPTFVVDLLWGEPARAAVEAAARGARVVQIGQSAGAEATLTSAAVRGKQLEILGYSNFGVPSDDLAREYRALVERAAAGDVRLEIQTVELAAVGDAWRRQASGYGRKLVLVP